MTADIILLRFRAPIRSPRLVSVGSAQYRSSVQTEVTMSEDRLRICRCSHSHSRRACASLGHACNLPRDAASRVLRSMLPCLDVRVLIGVFCSCSFSGPCLHDLLPLNLLSLAMPNPTLAFDSVTRLFVPLRSMHGSITLNTTRLVCPIDPRCLGIFVVIWYLYPTILDGMVLIRLSHNRYGAQQAFQQPTQQNGGAYNGQAY